MIKKNVYLSLLVLFLSLFVFSQEKTMIPKKTIGLVLSGGGSRGYAHIGVLKVLEELNIKPDYITGTSQGALIGALYSLGYSVSEIEQFIKEVNWKTIFSDQQNYVDIPILSKEEFPKLPLRLFFDHSIIPKIPIGLIEGHELQALFSKLAWRSHSYANFDSFPIPFRCVSSDLVSGKPVVFKEGDLATAMRASMSVPALFTPVDKDSMLLVDGGVFRNFPVQECKDMGADFIIGVYAVGNKDEPKKEAINSMSQLISVGFKAFLNDLEKEDIELTDVLIVPELNKYRGVEMKRSTVIAQIGETAARNPKVYKQLKKLASYQKAQLKDSVYEKATQGKHINKDVPEKKISIHSIKVKGCQHTDPKKILKTSGLHENTQLTSTDVSEAIAKVYKTDDFKKITYHIEKQKTKNNLVLKVYEKEAFQFRIGSQYGLGYGFEGLFSLSYKDFLIHNSQVSVKAGVSKSPRVFLDYTYNPNQSKNIAFSIQSYTQYTKIPYSFDYLQTTYKTGYFSEFAFDTKFKLAWSPLKNISIQTSLGNQIVYILFKNGLDEVYNIEKKQQNQTYFSSGIRVNTLNDVTFPTKGMVFQADFTHQFLIHNSVINKLTIPNSHITKNTIYQLQYKQYFLLTKRFSIIPSLQLGFMDQKPFFTQSFFIGGVANYSRPNRINFAGLEANERVTDNYFIPGLGVQINLANTWFLQIEGQSLSAVNFKDLSSEVLLLKDNQIRNIQVTVSYKSILGPLSFSLAKNIGEKGLMPFVAIGFGF